MAIITEEELRVHIYYLAVYNAATNTVKFVDDEVHPALAADESLYTIYKHSSLGGLTVSTVGELVSLSFDHAANITPINAVILFSAVAGLYETAKE